MLSEKLKSWYLVKGFSDFGTWLDYCVFTYLALQFDQNAVQTLSWFLTAKLFGAFISGPFAGKFVRSEKSIQWMIASDVLRAILLVVLILQTKLEASTLYVIAGGLSFFGGVFEISLRSKIPEIKGSHTLESINSSFILASALGMVGGVLVSGIFNKFALWRWAIAIDTLTFIVSVIFLISLQKFDRKIKIANSNAEKSASESFQWASIPSNILKAVLGIVILRGIDAFGSSTHNLSLPLLAKREGNEMESLLFGALLAVWALGKFLVKFKIKIPATSTTFFWSTVGMSASFIVLMYMPHWTLCLLAIFVCGIFDAIAEAHGITLIQRTRETHSPALVTKALGLWTSFQSVGVLAGCLLFGTLVKQENFTVWVLVGHGIAIASAVLIRLFQKREHANSSIPCLTALR
jgi:MFS family permease